MKASEIAGLLGAELRGGADPEITGAAPLERAGPGDVSFVARARYLPYLESSSAGLVLVAAAVAERTTLGRAWIVVEDVHAALARVLPALYPETPVPAGVHATADIAADAQLGKGVSVGAGACIHAGARIGARTRIGEHVVVGAGCSVDEDVVLHPHVVLYPRTRIGARSVVHAGARLGVDGFGYAAVDGLPRKIPQVGDCIIGEDVEIGANVTVDRGSIGTTEIGDHVKIDNLVHVGHNVRIGAGSIIVAQAGIAGSTRLGAGVTLGGQAGLNGHITIGDGAKIAAQAGVFGDVPAGEVWSGYPARPHGEALRAQANIMRLGSLRAKVRELEREIEGRRGEE